MLEDVQIWRAAYKLFEITITNFLKIFYWKCIMYYDLENFAQGTQGGWGTKLVWNFNMLMDFENFEQSTQTLVNWLILNKSQGSKTHFVVKLENFNLFLLSQATFDKTLCHI